jgi:CheY-like chemotaxis protein
MTFTFQDEYEVHTSSDARRALEILDEHAPFAVALSDQRMPNMSGVEFVTEVCRRHPETVRMILTGFSDMDAIIQAINAGHVYAYITKPWEPEQLKQVMRQAVEHYQLTVRNEQLLKDLERVNLFLEAVMDELDTGALAVDAGGAIQAVNRPARDYLALEGDPRGRPLKEVLERHRLDEVGAVAFKVAGDEAVTYDDVEVRIAGQVHRLRVTTRVLADEREEPFGRVIFLKEVSHEPLRRRFDEVVRGLVRGEDSGRASLEQSRERLRELGQEIERSRIESPGMGELAESIGRTTTAIDNWLDVDDALAGEDFPDAQLLQDRMRVALTRWPLGDEVPERIRELAGRVEEYYESGENPKQRVL